MRKSVFRKLVAYLLLVVIFSSEPCITVFANDAATKLSSAIDQVLTVEGATDGAEAILPIGKCNYEDLQWEITAAGKLIVTGSGNGHPWSALEYRNLIKSVDISGLSDVSDCSYMFCYCTNIVELDLSGFDTSNVTTMAAMFVGCTSLRKVDLSGIDVSNVVNMNAMFYDCSSLVKVDFSGFDSYKLTEMTAMFYGCSSLEELDLSEFDTRSVTNMDAMFYDCSSLEELNICGFDTGNVSRMDAMFYNCSSLKKLNLSNFNTNSLVSTQRMFHNCGSIKKIYFGNFSTSNVRCISSMFSGCTSLEELDLSSFDLSSLSENSVSGVFDGAVSLNTIKTPKNLAFRVPLPVTMYDASGVSYNSLPMLRTYSSTLRDSLPEFSVTSFSLGGDTVGLTVPTDVPFLGGNHELKLPKDLPVSLIIEKGKVKVGLNIAEDKLETDSVKARESQKDPEKDKWDVSKYGLVLGADKTKKDLADNWEELQKKIKEGKALSQTDLRFVQACENMRWYDGKIPGFEESVTIDVAGYLECDYIPNHITKIEGSIIVAFEYEGEHSWEIGITPFPVIGVLPVTIIVNTSAGLTASAIVCYDFDKFEWQNGIDLDITAGLKLTGGVGWKDLYAGVYGKAETGLNTTVASYSKAKPEGINRWDLYGEAGVSWQFLIWSNEYPLISTSALRKIYPSYVDPAGKLLLYSRTEPSIIGGDSGSDYNGASSVNNYDFAKNAELLEIEAENARSETAADGTLVENAYSGASPALVTDASGNKILIYALNDTAADASLNSIRLAYRVCEKDSDIWSDPKNIDNDNTTDGFPEVLKTDNGDIYVAWVDSDKAYEDGDEADFADFLKHLTIDAAKYDPETGTFISLSPKLPSERNYAYAPSLYYSDDEGLVLTWAENKSDKFLGLTADNVIYKDVYKDGVWTLSEVKDGLNSVRGLEAGEGNILYFTDDDNDLSTEGCTLYDDVGTEIGKGSFSSISYTTIPGVSGKRFAINDAGGLYYMESGSEALNEVLPRGTMDTGSEFFTDKNSIRFLKTSDLTRNLAVSYYSDGRFGQADITVLPEKEYIDSFYISEGQAAYLYTDADYNEDADVWTRTSGIRILDDLKRMDAAVDSVGFLPDEVVPGEELQTVVYITNKSTVSINKVNVRVSCGDSVLKTDELDVNLMPGETLGYDLGFILPADLSDSSDIKIEVFTEDDADISNSAGSISVAKADLDINVETVTEDGHELLKITVSNNGTVATDAVTVVTAEDGTELFSESDTLVAGADMVYTEDVSNVAAQLLTVSTSGSSEEFYEFNNHRQVYAGYTEGAPSDGDITDEEKKAAEEAEKKAAEEAAKKAAEEEAARKAAEEKAAADKAAEEAAAEAAKAAELERYNASVPDEQGIVKAFYEDNANSGIFMLPGELKRLSLTPSDSYIYGVRWSVESGAAKKCIKVKDGVVTALKTGTATVTAVYRDTEPISFKVTVIDEKEFTSKNVQIGDKAYAIKAKKSLKTAVGKKSTSLSLKLPGSLKGSSVSVDMIDASGNVIAVMKADGSIDASICSIEKGISNAAGTKLTYAVNAKDAGAAYVRFTAAYTDASGKAALSQALTKLIVTRPVSVIDSSVNELKLDPGEGKRLIVSTDHGNTDAKVPSFKVNGKGIKVTKSGYVLAMAAGATGTVTVKLGKITKVINVTVTDNGSKKIMSLNKTGVAKASKKASSYRLAIKTAKGVEPPSAVSYSIIGDTDADGVSISADGVVSIASGAKPGCYSIKASAEGYTAAYSELIVK